mgnify:CR=1 FL=1
MRPAIHRTTTGLRARTGRVAAVGAVVAGTLMLTPATATAAPPSPNDVNPLVNCVMRHDDGGFTAVLGYHNTSNGTVQIRNGSDNFILPSRYNDELPTRFERGRRDGVLSLTFERGSGAIWILGNSIVAITQHSASSCPPSTQMPGEGNGLGPVVGLAVAGVLGAVVLRRVRRLAQAPVSAPAPEPDRVSTDA